jgi:hypothetical protein
LTTREIVHEEDSSWEVDQSVLHNTVKFKGDCMKNYEDFAPNFGDKGTGCLSLQYTGYHMPIYYAVFA